MDNDFLNQEGTIVKVADINREMRKSFIDYSMSVIVSRALPDVRDGLKPVHRRIIYTMHEDGLTSDKPFRKCATTVGSVLGRYHPHGDASVYDALVRLAQNFSMRYKLVDGHGNFGSIDGDPPAAYRYTEARMSKMAQYMVTDIGKDTIDFDSNFDDTRKEPKVLPSRYPNLLVNGSSGIAVGMATNIPPHNLGEVCDAIDAVIDNPDIGLDELMNYIKGPDFPTGGIIMGRSGIRSAYATGRGKLTLRAKADIEEDSKGRQSIVVTEIPYMVNKSRIIQGIADLVKNKRIEGISYIRDESDRDGMRIVFELKRDATPQLVLNQLYHYSLLQETVGVIMIALVDGQPRVLTLKEMLQKYIDFQGEVITRRTQYDLKKAADRAHILEGLKRAIDIVDEIIATIRACKGGIPEAKAAIMEKFGFDDPQASAIVAYRIGQLAGLEILKIEEELSELESQIKEYQELLSDYSKIMEVFKKELGEIRDKFRDDRRTEIRAVEGDVDIEDLIPEEDCVITLTHFGYVKRQASSAYRIQKRGGRGISGMKQRDEDFVEEMFVTSSHDQMLFFTNQGRVFSLKCYEIPEGNRTARGTNMVNLLALAPEEKVTSMMRVGDFDEEHYLVMVTKNGLIKRTRLDAYKNIRKSGLIALGLNEGDELAWVRLTDGKDELVIATRNGMAIRFSENDVRPMSRTAMGVKAISLKPGDSVVGMVAAREDACILTVTDKGQGRRTPVSDYPVQGRNGMGKINYKVNDTKGYVCGIKVVRDDQDLILISNDGIIIRIAAADVNIMSRYATGVRVMRLADNDSVVAFAAVEHLDESEKAEDELDEETTESMDEAQVLEDSDVQMTEEDQEESGE
ncbi:MAG TPA: DNA gyrase subunit A [Candidatus Faecivivens stercoripullorum]|uniref:DNA gyrase subunit A n=1 Tax=Candidatus Faecivivens stercoripullorum TaxID=2840805 RepID=A0A9D1H7D9_9FIRM|nr:DNA gyrase subunit A [Candidatus Faecivivens stercoripullorum]